MNVTFLVINSAALTILSRPTAISLDILRLGPLVHTNSVNSISIDHTRDNLFDEYNDRFTGLGQLKDTAITIHVDETIHPVAQRPRRLPIQMIKEVDAEIDKLLDLSVLEPVKKPPSWINPLVVVPKKKGIRLCVDMRVANTAIIREPYQIPTLEEILHTFNGCTMFTTLDLNQGYHQISLDEQSRDLTAFASRRGILRYTRLIYGISSASEIYQREVEKALHGLEGVRNISDDIIIGGKTADELLNRTIQTLNRLRECNLTINKDKCKFFCEELVYMGHVLSRAGLSPDKSKVESIVSLKPPTNQKELRSFLGMITYC